MASRNKVTVAAEYLQSIRKMFHPVNVSFSAVGDVVIAAVTVGVTNLDDVLCAIREASTLLKIAELTCAIRLELKQ